MYKHEQTWQKKHGKTHLECMSISKKKDESNYLLWNHFTQFRFLLSPACKFCSSKVHMDEVCKPIAELKEKAETELRCSLLSANCFFCFAVL